MFAAAIPSPEASPDSPDPARPDGFSSPAAQAAFRLQNTLSAMPPDQMERTLSLADEMREVETINFVSREAVAPDRRTGGFDLMPLVLDGAEWARIEAGLVQRLRAWNLFLRDIYSGQEILQAGVIPFEIVYSDPNFHRGCARRFTDVSYLQFTAFDLQQDARGQWQVIENHLGVAEGATYALKKRQVLRQVAPRLFDGLEILPVEDFAAQLLDVILAPVRDLDNGARAVLLAQGSGDPHYLDHAALARQMGVPIVQGTDLVVLDSRLYLKTIAGVEPVDAVLRRLATSLLDPVTFDPASRHGVPGLLSCVRRNALTMANGLGSDLANNRALAAHLPAIIEYYTGDRPLLSSPQLLDLGDIDVREEVADRREAYVIRHAWKRGPAHEWVLRHLTAHDWGRFWTQVEASPSEYIAHKLPNVTPHPCWTATGLRHLPVMLRAFGLGQDRISPCALAWTGSSATLTGAVAQNSDTIKDVWILRSVPATAAAIHAQAEEAPRRLRLTSRVAESLFWMGRYAERAEVTVRALRTVQMQPWPLNDNPSSRQRQPLWAALAALSGLKADYFVRPTWETIYPQAVPYHFLLNLKHPGSVVSCLRSCRQNAENIREHFPPEVWSVLNLLYLQLAFHAEQPDTDQVRIMLEDRSLQQDVVKQLDELSGALEKHMLHNDAWHFWQMGVYAERSLMTMIILGQVFAPEIGGEPVISPVSSSNLEMLLQMVAGQYAYRSLYHARPVAARVARLLLQDEEFPRSALFCLQGMRRALTATLGERPAKGADTPLRNCGEIINALNFIDMATYFPPMIRSGAPEDDLADMPTYDFPRKLDEIIGRVMEFNVLISDHYLDHQVVFREPELFDPVHAR